MSYLQEVTDSCEKLVLDPVGDGNPALHLPRHCGNTLLPLLIQLNARAYEDMIDLD
jgi:hypothetical protein